MRVALHYSKLGPVRYISHLDFQNLWQKAFVMAGFKLAMTQGFNPRPRLRFTLPLATGYQSKAELVEAYLEQPVGLKELIVGLNNVLPRGVEILGATELPEQFPKLTALVDGLRYRVELPEELGQVDLSSVADGTDVLRADVVSGGLELMLAVKDQRSVRPEKVAGELWPDVGYWDVTRLEILTAKVELSPWPVGLGKLEQTSLGGTP